MKFRGDMNLSPGLCPILIAAGHDAAHWTAIGDSSASDTEIMQWARDNDHVVLTHDLDFGALLAATQAEGPSVIRIRTEDVMPDQLAPKVVQLLSTYEDDICAGALIALERARNRVRILPLNG